MTNRVLIINGSLGGRGGNTTEALKSLHASMSQQVELDQIDLAESFSVEILESRLRSADGFVFATGTYWDSWGSPLQCFLEQATALEASDIWLGKPAAVLVTMHSVGGKEVLSRLQGVLSTLGLLLPPMTGLVYSLANHLAIESLRDGGSNSTHLELGADFWRLDDLEIVAANLVAALKQRTQSPAIWTPWPVDDGNPQRRWLTSRTDAAD
jgi:NAD(P)H-dependent FMN reductase